PGRPGLPDPAARLARAAHDDERRHADDVDGPDGAHGDRPRLPRRSPERGGRSAGLAHRDPDRPRGPAAVAARPRPARVVRPADLPPSYPGSGAGGNRTGGHIGERTGCNGTGGPGYLRPDALPRRRPHPLTVTERG